MPHSHDHGSCAHEADGIDPLEMGIQYSLFQKIDLVNLECLNELEEGSAKNVFKSFDKRLDFSLFVESDCDQELLFNIPFTGNIKLKGIRVIGSNDDSHPKKVRLFKNRTKMTFDDVTANADQEFELERDLQGTIEYNTQVSIVPRDPSPRQGSLVPKSFLSIAFLTIFKSSGCEIQLRSSSFIAFPDKLWR